MFLRNILNIILNIILFFPCSTAPRDALLGRGVPLSHNRQHIVTHCWAAGCRCGTTDSTSRCITGPRVPFRNHRQHFNASLGPGYRWGTTNSTFDALLDRGAPLTSPRYALLGSGVPLRHHRQHLATHYWGAECRCGTTNSTFDVSLGRGAPPTAPRDAILAAECRCGTTYIGYYLVNRDVIHSNEFMGAARVQWETYPRCVLYNFSMFSIRCGLTVLSDFANSSTDAEKLLSHDHAQPTLWTCQLWNSVYNFIILVI